LGVTIVVLLVAAWFHFSGRDTLAPDGATDGLLRRIVESPLGVATWLVVAFEVFSLTAAMIGQYPAWTVGRSNLDALNGKTCGLANDVMVEENPNAGMLTPSGVPVADGLGAVISTNFTPNGIPFDVSADQLMQPPGGGAFVDTTAGTTTRGEAGTEGGTAAITGINGSRAQLPYNLDPAHTPVLGSFQLGIQAPAALRSAWYRLSPRGAAGPLLVVSAAGRFDPREVTVQWAGDDGKVAGSASFADIGSPPAWRNLRLPLSAIPASATLIRLTATDDDLAPQHWIALTPPRIPQMRTLQDVVGSRDPVLLDWLVGLAFPCQRPFGHNDGVNEVPKWRILPDRFGAEANSPVMDNLGGGPLGVTELLLRPTTVATYLNHDWFRDWGTLQRFTLYYPDAKPARLDLGSATRSGLWSPAPMRQ
jgi:arabinosyltransferase C